MPSRFRGPLVASSSTHAERAPADILSRIGLPAQRVIHIDFTNEANHVANAAGSQLMTPVGNGFGATPAPTIAAARRTSAPFSGLTTLQLTPSDANNEGTQLVWGTPGGGAGVAADGFGLGTALASFGSEPCTAFYNSIWGFRSAGSDHTGGVFAFGFMAHDGVAANCVLDTAGAAQTTIHGAYLRYVGAASIECVSVGSLASLSTTVALTGGATPALVETSHYLSAVRMEWNGLSATGAGLGSISFYHGLRTGPIRRIAQHSMTTLGAMNGLAPGVCGVRVSAAVIIEIAGIMCATTVPVI